MLNLDTHVLVSMLIGNLSDGELRLIQGEQLVISDIVLWELAKMTQLGRLEMDLDSAEFHLCSFSKEIVGRISLGHVCSLQS
jgi:PIN domain nuclease of toxin-antitoxin system